MSARKKLNAQAVHGTDLKWVLDEYMTVLAIVITFGHELRGCIQGFTSVSHKVITLGKGEKAIRGVFETQDRAVLRTEP